MKRLFTAVKNFIAKHRSLNNKWTDYDQFMKANFPHVVESRDKHYH